MTLRECLEAGKKMDKDVITAEQFHAYESVRTSGKTNMFAIKNVQYYAEEDAGVFLSYEVIAAIQNNYAYLKNKYMAGDNNANA